MKIKQIQGLEQALLTPFTVSALAPSNPIENQVWFEPINRTLWIYILDGGSWTWVQLI